MSRQLLLDQIENYQDVIDNLEDIFISTVEDFLNNVRVEEQDGVIYLGNWIQCNLNGLSEYLDSDTEIDQSMANKVGEFRTLLTILTEEHGFPRETFFEEIYKITA